MQNIEKIAKELTKAEREALDCFKPDSMIAKYKFDWATLSALERKGLIKYPDQYFVSITETGIAARDYQDVEEITKELTVAQDHIIRHSLGLNYKKKPYRNHFCTNKGTTDWPDCMALVKSGHMTRRVGNPITGGDDVFSVTDAGKAAVGLKLPAARQRTNL